MQTEIQRYEAPASAEMQPATVHLQADRNPVLVYLKRLNSERSRITMGGGLKVIANLLGFGDDIRLFPWHELRYQHTAAIRAMLADKYSAATANLYLSALRGVLQEAWRLGYVSAEEYQRAKDVKSVRGSKPDQAEKGRHLSPGELTALIGVCLDGTSTGARDAAIIALAYTCGLRRAELVGLQVANYDPQEAKLVVLGKGNKQRVIPLTLTAKEALDDWLALRGLAPGSVFTRIVKGKRITVNPLTGQAITFILQERAEQAKVKAFSPHDLRRTFAGDLLDTGADLSTVQKLMGHEAVSTTAGYDRRGARAKVEAVSRLHIAYRKP